MNKHKILQAEKLFFAKLYSKTHYALQISESKQHALLVPSSYNSIPSAQSTLIFPIISVISILKSVINRCLFPSFIFHHKSKFPLKKKLPYLQLLFMILLPFSHLNVLFQREIIMKPTFPD